MNREETIEHLKGMKADYLEYGLKEDDVQALEYAINELERTAQEVPVQEQSIKEILSEISILLITASSITRKVLENNFSD
ncbi:hypothetical protein [Clostridium sp.]|uniref:hypothetical protein n=1 Tax=Clostridium sp. TaxID=1506 RepID=UPI00261FB7D0|nr:hypothetical protein [Clostridium sp.]